jgi:hypothetical protein
MILSPILSSSETPPNVAWQHSWVNVLNDQNRSLFAQATYPINNLGSNGITVITGTTAYYGSFKGIQTIVSSTQFTALTASGTTTSISGIQIPIFPSNFLLTGEYSGIKLASGSAIAYNS